MKKKYINFALALLVAGASFMGMDKVAFAQTQHVDWEVTYTGSDFDSTYNSAKASISNTMPGDTIEFNVTYNNGTNEAATFYMNADVIKSLEEESEANGGAYSYKILNSTSSIPIFDSETIGGEATDVVGLNQVSSKEGAYFSLGSIPAGESGVVTVAISLDGNSQNNNYMSTLAQLQIKFGAEPTSEADGGETIVEKVKKTIVKEIVTVLEDGTEVVIIDDENIPLNGGVGNPRTGDSIMPIVFCSVALMLGIALIVVYFMMTKKQKREA